MTSLDLNSVLYPLIGGGLIGLAATIMLAFNGRVTGISGILNQTLAKPEWNIIWGWMFLAGMIGAGFIMEALQPQLFVNLSNRGYLTVAAAGLLVGFGTLLGSGCTSGHGICGLSRLSVRSIIATLTFMAFGVLSVQVFNFFAGGQS